VPDTPTPFAWVPSGIRQYGDARSRANGTLDLTFAPIAGRTRITHAAYQSPLAVQCAQYRDPFLPTLAVVPILTIGGGVLGGDRLCQIVRAEAGAMVHLTTMTATKLYRMEHGYAAQDTTVIAGEGAVVEYLPAPVIAQRSARYAARTRIIAAPTATVICGDVLIPGRLAMGERGVYDAVSFVTQGCSALTGEPGWRDALTIAPAQLPGGGAAVVGTLFGITRTRPAVALADALHHACLSDPVFAAVQWGVSDLPDAAGVIVRIVGEDSRAVQETHHAAWHQLRMALLGVGAPPRV